MNTKLLVAVATVGVGLWLVAVATVGGAPVPAAQPTGAVSAISHGATGLALSTSVVGP